MLSLERKLSIEFEFKAIGAYQRYDRSGIPSSLKRSSFRIDATSGSLDIAVKESAINFDRFAFLVSRRHPLPLFFCY